MCEKPQDWRRKGEVCLPLRISHIQSEVPRDSSSSSSRAVVEEEEEEKQEQVVVGREEIFLLPPFPCLLFLPLSIHRLRPSPSLVFFPKSKQGREVSLSIQVEEGGNGSRLGRRRKE